MIFLDHDRVIVRRKYLGRMFLLIIILILFFYPIDIKERITIPLFILAGQSNAVGYGADWDKSSTALHRHSQNTLIWYSQGTYKRPYRSNNWLPLFGMRHRSIPAFGSEMSIGPIAKPQLSSYIGIIKIAFNGTTLAKIDEIDWNVHSENELFRHLITESKKAMKHMPAGIIGQPVGFFWIQGESDAKSSEAQPELSSQYKQNLKTLINNLRSEFDSPYLPVVIARISVPEFDARGRHFGYRDIIREAQQTVADADPYALWISTDDLPRQPDDLHFTAQGQLELGRRYFAAWLQLTQGEI